MPTVERVLLTISKTYASVDSSVGDLIKQKFGFEKGTVAARRYRESGEWVVQIYWHDVGSERRKNLGKLKDVLKQIGIETSQEF